MRCASLISGSKANSFYIENDNEALLIDAGLSLPKMELAFAKLSIIPDKIKGILVTHEHEDHIRHLKRIAHYYKIPVYLTQESHKKSGLALREYYHIKPGDDLVFGELNINTFQVLHDAVMCLGFVFHGNDKQVFYASDIGSYDDSILAKAENSHFIGIEANYDANMLQKCRYPQYLKDRISGGAGHLANHEAARFVKEAAGKNTRHIMFLHISENSNCVSLVEKMIDQELCHHIPEVRYAISNRHTHSPLLTI